MPAGSAHEDCAVKHDTFIIDLFLHRGTSLQCLSHSTEILECSSKACTKSQINTLCAKKVDIYSHAGVSILTFMKNSWQVLISTKIHQSTMY